MTVTIVPAAGAGVLFTQQGVGTTPGYSALDDRRSNSGPLQEGVQGSGASAQDFMVQSRIAGSNMSVDITMPTGGAAYVQGDTITGQGLYCVPVHAANINEAIAAADATNPRIDQIILEIQDNVLDASGGNLSRTRVLTGTPTGGATLANRSGATALPGSALLLADVLVGAAVSSITNTVIRDRRKWARGYFDRQAPSPSYSTASGTMVAIDSTNLSQRVECSGAPVRMRLSNPYVPNSTNGAANYVAFSIDAASLDGMTAPGGSPSGTLFVVVVWLTPGAAGGVALNAEWTTVPSAGSHVFQPIWATNTGTLSMSSGLALFVVEELPRQNSKNNSVTSG